MNENSADTSYFHRVALLINYREFDWFFNEMRSPGMGFKLLNSRGDQILRGRLWNSHCKVCDRVGGRSANHFPNSNYQRTISSRRAHRLCRVCKWTWYFRWTYFARSDSDTTNSLETRFSKVSSNKM